MCCDPRACAEAMKSRPSCASASRIPEMSSNKRKIKQNADKGGSEEKKKKCDDTEICSTKSLSSSLTSSKPTDSTANASTSDRIGSAFYQQDCESLAKALLGKRLVRLTESGERLSGVIVETEAYLGIEDKAAHSYKGKKTEKTAAMFMDPGTAYVYHIYGMYCCMNISSKGEGAAVLLRSLEAKEGLQTMEKFRSKKPSKKMKEKDLSNGPSKLCQALSIKKDQINKQDMITSKHIWLESDSDIEEEKIVISKRINIGYAEEWIDKPLRFYVLGNPSVSVRDKEAEEALSTAKS
ncbi:hypothetical protein FSP39_008911 [Pinctada imbricata]|uniref:DNA-3-methyladenine glycosylase n=1 Tax=Pinctada imbricata TaxID=66713 RepID=A0AA88XXZ8_PINIB|nr:hypothetical protein FSP39_008911 [Pinctada imbricata]